MWRRSFVAALLAVVGVVVFLLVLASSQPGARRLCRVAEAALADLSGQPVAIGRCVVEPLSARVSIEHVSLGPAQQPVVRAERLSASLGLRALLSGRIQIKHIELVSPRVALDLSMLPRGGESTPEKDGGCLPTLGHLELGSLRLTDGDVSILLPGNRRTGARGVNLVVAGREQRLKAELSTDRTWFIDGGLEAAIERSSLRGTLDLASGAAKIESLDVSAAEGSLFAEADFVNVCTPRGRLGLTLRLDLDRLGKTLLSHVPHLGGNASVRARASIDGLQWEAGADLEVDDAKVLDFAPGRFTLSARADAGQVTISRLEIPMPSGHIRAAGSMALAPPYETHAEAQMERLVLGELLEKLGVPDLTVHLQTTGTARLSGPLLGPRGGPRLIGQFEAQVPEFGVYNRSWRRRQGAERYARIQNGSVRTRFVLEHDRIILRDTQLAVGTTSVEANGVVHFSPERGMSLEYRFPSVQIADVGPFGPADVSGSGTATGTLAGPYAALDIRASIDARDVSVFGMEIGAVTGDARVDLERMRLDVPQALVRRGRSSMRGNGSVSFADDVMLQAEVDVVRAHAIDLAGVFRRLVPAIRSLEGHADAFVTGSAEVNGTASALEATASLELQSVEVHGQHFPAGRLDATLEGGRRAVLKTLHLTRDEATVDLRGALDLENGDYSVALSTHGLTAAQLDPVVSRLPGIAGELSLSVSGEGNLSNPSASARLTLRDAWLGAQPLVTARLRFDLQDNRVALTGTLTSPRDRTSLAPAGDMRHVLEGRLDLRDELPFQLHAGLDIPDVRSALAAGLVPSDLQAALTGDLHASGELSRPGDLRARLELSRMWMNLGRREVENVRPVTLSFEDRTLVLHAMPLRGPLFTLDASGVRQQDGTLDFTLQGETELGFLGELAPEMLDETSGQLHVDLAVSGTEHAPVVVGNAQVSRLALRLRDAPVALSEGHGTLSFSPELVSVDDLRAQVNGGRLEVGGQLELRRFRPQSLRAEARLTEIPLRFDDVPLVLSGMPTLSGPLDQLTLGGDLEVSRFRFARDLELERTLVRALELARRPPAPKVFSRSAEFLNFDLGVHLGDVRVDNNLLQADVRGDLRLTGTNRRPGLLGAASFAGGRAVLRGTELDISSGVVHFTDRNRIRAAFDVRADARVRDYDIHVIASGTPQQPRLVLSSEPPLPEADIVTLLTLGVTSRDFDRTGSASIGGVLLDAAYNASGLSQQMRRLMPKTDLLKDASLRVTSAYNELSGNIEPIAQFEGKLVTDGWKLRAQTSLVGGRGRRLQAEYRWDDRLSVIYQADGDNPSAPSFGDHGLDLRLHWESP